MCVSLNNLVVRPPLGTSTDLYIDDKNENGSTRFTII